MKKHVALLLILCLAFSFVGCSENLPDPEVSLRQTFDSITSADETYMAMVRAGMKDIHILEKYPQLENEYLEVQKAIAKQMEYAIVESEIDTETKTAIVTVDVTAANEKVIDELLEEWFNAYVTDIINDDEEIDGFETNRAMLEEMARLYSDPSVERKTYQVKVRMTYDAEAKLWLVDNPEVLYSVDASI